MLRGVVAPRHYESHHRACTNTIIGEPFLLSMSMDRQLVLWRVRGDHRLDFVSSLPTIGGFPYELRRNPFRTASTRVLAVACGDRCLRLLAAEKRKADAAATTTMTMTTTTPAAGRVGLIDDDGEDAFAHDSRVDDGDGADHEREREHDPLEGVMGDARASSRFGPSDSDPPLLLWRGIADRVTSVAWHPLAENTVVYGLADGCIQRVDTTTSGANSRAGASDTRSSSKRRGRLRSIARHGGSVAFLAWRLVRGTGDDDEDEDDDDDDDSLLADDSGSGHNIDSEPVALLYSLSPQTGQLLECDLRHPGARPVAFHRRLRCGSDGGGGGGRRRDTGPTIQHFAWHADGCHLAVSAGGEVRLFWCGQFRGDDVQLLRVVAVEAPAVGSTLAPAASLLPPDQTLRCANNDDDNNHNNNNLSLIHI